MICQTEGANVLPCQSLGGQMSSYAIFHRGADVRGGKCPAPDLVNNVDTDQ